MSQVMEMSKPHVAVNNTVHYSSIIDDTADISFYTDLASAKTIESLKEKILLMVEKLGFSDFFFSVPGKSMEGVITTLPNDIYDDRLTGEGIRNDVLVQHAQKSTSPVFLSTIINFARSAPICVDAFELCEKRFDVMESHEFYDCYAVPRPSYMGGKNAIFLVADKGASREEFRLKVNRCKAILHLLGEAIANIGVSSFPVFFSGDRLRGVSITPKPLRLLNVLAKDNITLKQAAVKLCISLDTANKHIAAAKTALGANTQAAAIYRAVKAGLVEIDED